MAKENSDKIKSVYNKNNKSKAEELVKNMKNGSLVNKYKNSSRIEKG